MYPFIYLSFLSNRLKLEIHGSQFFAEAIRSLSCCSSLVQLGLITTSEFQWYKDEAKFTALFVDLVERLPKLIALLVVLPCVSQSLCTAATAALESKFRPTRPCFCVQITDSLDSDNPPKLPFAHYKTLAHDQLPSVGGLPYHLTPDQIY